MTDEAAQPAKSTPAAKPKPGSASRTPNTAKPPAKKSTSPSTAVDKTKTKPTNKDQTPPKSGPVTSPPKADPVTNLHAPNATVVQHVAKQASPTARYQALDLAIKHYEGTSNGWQDVINLALHFEDYLRGRLPEQQDLAPSPNPAKTPTKPVKASTKSPDRAEYVEEEDDTEEDYGDDEFPYDGYDDDGSEYF